MDIKETLKLLALIFGSMLITLLVILTIVEFEYQIIEGPPNLIFERHIGFFSFLLSAISLIITVITIYYLHKTTEQTKKQLDLAVENRDDSFFTVLDVDEDEVSFELDLLFDPVQRNQTIESDDYGIHIDEDNILTIDADFRIQFKISNISNSIAKNIHIDVYHYDLQMRKKPYDPIPFLTEKTSRITEDFCYDLNPLLDMKFLRMYQSYLRINDINLQREFDEKEYKTSVLICQKLFSRYLSQKKLTVFLTYQDNKNRDYHLTTNFCFEIYEVKDEQTDFKTNSIKLKKCFYELEMNQNVVIEDLYSNY